jgi:uncharacterized protein YndB with AHSA1/START domain
MTMAVTDRIEKQAILRAPRSRVWRALTDVSQFNQWFGVKLQGRFVAGARVRGQITHPNYQHVTLEMLIERIEPETLFSYRWHPHAVDAAADYSNEPMTLVEFRLEDTGEGDTLLTISESGFDRIPLSRRAEAFRMNDGGWTSQMRNLENYVSRA